MKLDADQVWGTPPAFHPGPPVIAKHWERIPEAEREAILAAIPDGMYLRLTAGYPGRPGTATVRLIHDGRLVKEARGTLTAWLVRSVLPGTTYMTDGAGYVTSITEEA